MVDVQVDVEDATKTFLQLKDSQDAVIYVAEA